MSAHASSSGDGTSSGSSAPAAGLSGKRSIDEAAQDEGSIPYAQKQRLEARSSSSWFRAAGDGGIRGSNSVAAALKKSETASTVSALKAKLSKPKDALPKPTLSTAKTGLTEEQRVLEQERHRERAIATGKPVPYYRK